MEPLKEKTRDESEDGRVGSAAVQLVAGDGGGRRSTSPLTAPENVKSQHIIDLKTGLVSAGTARTMELLSRPYFDGICILLLI